MTAREYLTQARMIDSRINSKLMELQRARELATKATGLVSDMPRNPSPDLQQMESRVVKIVDLEREINAEIDELVDLKRDIRELIAQIRKPEYRTLLELRYLGFRTWDAIAEEMGFEPRTIYRFHSNALRVVERLMRTEKIPEIFLQKAQNVIVCQYPPVL